METIILGAFVALVYLTLGFGVLDLTELLARRERDDPPEKLWTVACWPVILVICAVARYDGNE